MTASGVNARAVRELALALRSGPFRAALVLSLVVHLGLLAAFGWGRLGRVSEGERRIPLMRVRLLSPATVPAAVPAAPPVTPAQPSRRERPKRTAAAVPLPAPAPLSPAPEVPAHPVEQEPAPARASEVPAREESQQRPLEAPSSPVGVAAPPRESPRGTASPIEPPASATAESGSAGAGAAGTPPAATISAPQGPGPRDLAAVRHRIDSNKVYPSIAVRNGWEGSVLVEMRLEGDGRLATVRLLQSSGHALLDDETIAAVRRASPFPPVARVLTVPVEYRLVP